MLGHGHEAIIRQDANQAGHPQPPTLRKTASDRVSERAIRLVRDTHGALPLQLDRRHEPGTCRSECRTAGATRRAALRGQGGERRRDARSGISGCTAASNPVRLRDSDPRSRCRIVHGGRRSAATGCLQSQAAAAGVRAVAVVKAALQIRMAALGKMWNLRNFACCIWRFAFRLHFQHLMASVTGTEDPSSGHRRAAEAVINA